MTGKIAAQDIENHARLRANVDRFMADTAARFARPNTLLLDVAPQDHHGANPFFGPVGVTIDTVDLDPNSGATFVADLCCCIEVIGRNRYDYVVCTEVLEHTRQPFDAVASIYAMLKPGGLVFVTTPFNFRIHGPLPDCWRFTEHGLRELFKVFEDLQIDALESVDRFLMPLQYTLVARKPLAGT